MLCPFANCSSVYASSRIESQSNGSSINKQIVSDDVTVEPVVSALRKILFADEGLTELATQPYENFKIIRQAQLLFQEGKLKEADAVLESSRNDKDLKNNPWYWLVFAYVKQRINDNKAARNCIHQILGLPEVESRMWLYATAVLRELGEQFDDKTGNKVQGVVVEFNKDDLVVIVAGYEDGTSRLFFGNGGGVIGEKEDFPKETLAAAKQLVRFAQPLVDGLPLENVHPLPKPSEIRIALLTARGTRIFKSRFVNGDQDNRLDLVWNAASELLDLLRKMYEK
jgi:hypothetical protein